MLLQFPCSAPCPYCLTQGATRTVYSGSMFSLAHPSHPPMGPHWPRKKPFFGSLPWLSRLLLSLALGKYIAFLLKCQHFLSRALLQPHDLVHTCFTLSLICPSCAILGKSSASLNHRFFIGRKRQVMGPTSQAGKRLCVQYILSKRRLPFY